MGGFRVQGKDPSGARELLEDARALEEAGAKLLILECIPAPLAEKIGAELSIPAIGIGAGGGCDGQVLVFHDVLGLYGDFQPRFVKRYIEGGTLLKEALREHVEEVRRNDFPQEKHSFGMEETALETALKEDFDS